jgi:hypothetical protein
MIIKTTALSTPAESSHISKPGPAVRIKAAVADVNAQHGGTADVLADRTSGPLRVAGDQGLEHRYVPRLRAIDVAEPGGAISRVAVRCLDDG